MTLTAELAKQRRVLHSELLELGEPRSTASECRRFLFSVARRHELLLADALREVYYDNAFFNVSPSQSRCYPHRLRPLIDELGQNFADDLVQRTTRKQWQDESSEDVDRDAEDRQHLESLASNGQSALYDQLAIADMARAWRRLALRHLDKVCEHVLGWFSASLSHVFRAVGGGSTDLYTPRLMAALVDPIIHEVRDEMEDKVDGLLHFFHTTHGQKRLASDAARDGFPARFALRLTHTFVDNVNYLLTENLLMDRLPAIFTAMTVSEMHESTVLELVAETQAVSEKRSRIGARFSRLDMVLETCRVKRVRAYPYKRELWGNTPPMERRPNAQPEKSEKSLRLNLGKLRGCHEPDMGSFLETKLDALKLKKLESASMPGSEAKQPAESPVTSPLLGEDTASNTPGSYACGRMDGAASRYPAVPETMMEVSEWGRPKFCPRPQTPPRPAASQPASLGFSEGVLLRRFELLEQQAKKRAMAAQAEEKTKWEEEGQENGDEVSASQPCDPCRSSRRPQQATLPPATLQNYQLQLILLEQQNKKRLMAARALQDLEGEKQDKKEGGEQEDELERSKSAAEGSEFGMSGAPVVSSPTSSSSSSEAPDTPPSQTPSAPVSVSATPTKTIPTAKDPWPVAGRAAECGGDRIMFGSPSAIPPLFTFGEPDAIRADAGSSRYNNAPMGGRVSPLATYAKATVNESRDAVTGDVIKGCELSYWS